MPLPPRIAKIGKFLDEGNMDIILFLFEPGGEELIRAFSLLKGWHLAFLSHSGVVFLREKEEYGKFRESGEALIKDLEKGILKEAGSEVKKDSFFYCDPTRYYYYSRLLEALGHKKLAGLFLLQAIRVNPELFYLNKAAGDFFLDTGALTHAEIFYRNAIDIKKGDINVLLGLARIGIRKGDYQRAIDDLKAALDRKNRNTLFTWGSPISSWEISIALLKPSRIFLNTAGQNTSRPTDI